jgi:tRNA dimethylallyltransferase
VNARLSCSGSAIALPEKDSLSHKVGLKKAIIISGPTATGKTGLSLVLAKALGGEIISADSMQVYKHMNIGTAKATEEQMKLASHHLIDIRDLSQSFNVVEFYQEAMKAIHSIFARNKVPIIVGGTGFYIHTLLYGPPLGPPANQHVRRGLEEDMEKFGPEPLYEKLKEFDPVYANKITSHDRHKIIRALEIITLTHKRVSDFLRSPQSCDRQDINFRCWFIYYCKAMLYPRIEERCDEMIERGFLEEVRQLEKQGLRDNLSASQAIGYKQALDFLDSKQSQADYEEFVWSFKKASKRYAKRQFTWFRKEPMFRWLDLEAYQPSRAAEIILHDFENSL